MKYKAIICDLDGTLANIDHRRHHVEGAKKDWKAFFAGIVGDELNTMVDRYLDAVTGSHRILLVTGRPAEYVSVTETWLLDNRVSYNELFMRPAGDFRPDEIIKEEIYRTEIEPHYDVKLVLDDRAKVVKMWRSLGLPCWQVAAGDF